MKILISFICLSVLFVPVSKAQTETNGGLWAMGFNLYGQLGDGTDGGGLSDTNQPETIVPTNVMGIAGGGFHSLFILTDGSLWGMGLEDHGQLGDGTNTVNGSEPQTNKPEMIVPGNVIAASAGYINTMFVKGDGSLWGMGDDSNGELGDALGGATSLTNRPEMIVTNGVSAVASGLYHTLFLKTNGALWAMGRQSYGQLGDGIAQLGYYTNKPELITNGVVAIACGGDHSLFINTNGDLYAMGNDGYGQLGDGLGTTNATPVSISLPKYITNGVIAIAGGEYHSLFIRTNGSLWAMGYNSFGQLGDGTTNESNFPEMIVPSNVTAIACGGDHSLFIKSDGSLWAMGADFYGELGDGKTGVGQFFSNNVPEMIVPGGVAAIAGGFEHTLFIAPAAPTATNTYTVSSSSVGGTASSSGSAALGSLITVIATNFGGYVFSDWTSNGVVVTDVTNYSFTLNTNVILVANFAPLFTYTPSASPIGGGTVSLAGTNVSGAAITVTATNNTGYAFANWTSNGVVVSTTTNYTFNLNTNVTLVAKFSPPFILSVLAYPPDGGTVTGDVTNAAGSTNTVTATPNTGFVFVGWTGDATGTNSPLTVTLNTNVFIIANFAATGGTTATVSVATNGSGTVSPDLNGETLKVGNRYILTAKAESGSVFSNWTGSITTNKNPLTIKLESSLVLQANFVTNPYPQYAGIYNGLFTNTNGVVTEQTAGMLKGLHLNSRGAYSGSLLINGASHGISGEFSLGGTASNFIVRPEGQGDLKLLMTLTNGGILPQITGTVEGITWTSALTADLATNALPAAEYTMLMPPDTNNAPPTHSPGGDGYALITNYPGTAKNPAAATARIAGALGDGTAFTETVPVSGDGFVPVYASLYSGRGLLLGWINLDLTNTTGVSLTWIHPERATGLYQNGFTNTLLTNQILLAPWTNPPLNIDLLTNLAILDTINDPVAGLNFPVTISSSFELGPRPLSGSINPKTGQLKVTFTEGEKRTAGYGAILINTANGSATNSGGYYLTPSAAQAIKLEP